MKDTLAQFMEDYNCGRIGLDDLQRRLAFDQWRKDKPCKLIDYVPECRTPEDLMLCKEDYATLYATLVRLRKRTNMKTWKMLSMTAYGWKQKSIALRLGITQPTVSKSIDRIFPIAKELGLDVALRAVIAWQ